MIYRTNPGSNEDTLGYMAHSKRLPDRKAPNEHDAKAKKKNVEAREIQSARTTTSCDILLGKEAPCPVATIRLCTIVERDIKCKEGFSGRRVDTTFVCF